MSHQLSHPHWRERLALAVLGVAVAGLFALVTSGHPPKLPRASGEIPAWATGLLPAAPPRSTAQETAEKAAERVIDAAVPAPPLDLALPERRPETRRYSARLLHEAFERIGYELSAIGHGLAVPRIILAKVPRDLAVLDTGEMRKSVFLRLMLPIILQVNEEVFEDRRKVIDLRRRVRLGIPAGPAEQAWLDEMFGRYGAKNGDLGDLLRRLDAIPPSLALAQAAEESGWGTSRFAKDGNAVFGQWTFGRGMVPRGASADAKHRIRQFDTLADSARAYVHNLNTHAAYAEFRSHRASLRQTGRPLDGYALAGTLSRYSERGPDYIAALRSIIRGNDLKTFDTARLARGAQSPGLVAAATF